VTPLPHGQVLGALDLAGRHVGAVRVSVSLVTNVQDVERLLQFVSGWLDQVVDESAADACGDAAGWQAQLCATDRAYGAEIGAGIAEQHLPLWVDAAGD
jgi:hypothetical protein